jgi:peroxiredoxin (alkyl hydroperoxide reductase subunit C)
MTIQVGDRVPDVTLYEMTGDGPVARSSDEVFSGKKVVLFALPGAFTPTCSAKHVPGFVRLADEIKAKGVDRIACLSVNDAFVRAAGLDLDLASRGFGVRSQRYAMVVDDGVVTKLNVEAAGAFEVSSAESVLADL